MYFKQLQMSGFKSFADPTTVRFEPGTTAIVGPNGCGKSNILDALKWVLGEQRAKELRGSHMQDVVFNGSENRLPMGMAEVTVTFDNADQNLPVDFTEIEVTRRLYRSGESEYLLNRQGCRLKDIAEMFMDTGIGTSAYSMISQGKMDMIISSKPEDRRYIFEEAAGIIKYKTRKRIALRRLDTANQNLLRLTDIIAEVERQMRSLKRQVNAAIRYRELSAELKDLEIRSAWLQFDRLSEEIKNLKSQFTTAQNEFEKHNTVISEREAELESLSLQRAENERVLLVRRESVHEIDSEVDLAERAVALLKQQVEFTDEQQAQAGRERKQLQGRCEEITARIADADTKLTAVKDEIGRSRSTSQEKLDQHGQLELWVGEADTKVEAVRAREAAQLSNRSKAVTELEALDNAIEALDAQLKNVYERQDNESARRADLLTRIEHTRTEETAAMGKLSGVESAGASLREAFETKTTEAKRRHEEAHNLRQQHSRLDARLESLRELRDTYEGFAHGVSAVMRANDDAPLPGVIGPAGDLLSAQPGYEHAIEAALGNGIHNIVVESAHAARAAVAHLTTNKAGRVTFLPLDRLSVPAPDSSIAVPGDGVIGGALDYVDYEARLHPAVAFLLQDAVLVEDLDAALRLSSERPGRARYVTREGEVVSPNGAITGGRVEHEGRGLIGRSAEIDQLGAESGQMANAVTSVAAQAEALTDEAAALKTEIATNDSAQQTCRAKLNDLGVALAGMESESKALAEVLAELTRQRDEFSNRRGAMEEQRREVTGHVENMDSAEEALRTEMAEVQRAASEQRHALSVVANELSDLRMHEATLHQRLEEIERDRNREHQAIEESQQEIAKRVALTEQLEKDREGLDGEIKMNIERMSALSESKEEAGAKVVEAENEQKRIAQKLEGLEKELKETRTLVRDAQTRVHELELELRTDEERVGYFQERILTEYNVALSALKEADIGTDDHDSEARDKMVADIRHKLQRMGEVNLMAIEEFEALEKRHEFLATQAQDLEQARETLMSVIERCDTTIRAMFLEAFDEIANHFRNYFRRLFNGGQARIYLLDEDDPLESGIEIEARPPGKKPQSISLLSGGECAMTAVALLFSIFKAKPSPFCVLDEVDAPLDDANIGRFLGLLDEFTDESQFVIITHNKQTMARADALYGVTQQERGVSTLVSVRMTEAESSAA